MMNKKAAGLEHVIGFILGFFLVFAVVALFFPLIKSGGTSISNPMASAVCPDTGFTYKEYENFFKNTESFSSTLVNNCKYLSKCFPDKKLDNEVQKKIHKLFESAINNKNNVLNAADYYTTLKGCGMYSVDDSKFNKEYLGISLYLAGNYDDALKYITKSKTNPYISDLLLASIYSKNNDFDKSLYFFRKYAKSDITTDLTTDMLGNLDLLKFADYLKINYNLYDLDTLYFNILINDYPKSLEYLKNINDDVYLSKVSKIYVKIFNDYFIMRYVHTFLIYPKGTISQKMISLIEKFKSMTNNETILMNFRESIFDIYHKNTYYLKEKDVVFPGYLSCKVFIDKNNVKTKPVYDIQQALCK